MAKYKYVGHGTWLSYSKQSGSLTVLAYKRRTDGLDLDTYRNTSGIFQGGVLCNLNMSNSTPGFTGSIYGVSNNPAYFSPNSNGARIIEVLGWTGTDYYTFNGTYCRFVDGQIEVVKAYTLVINQLINLMTDAELQVVFDYQQSRPVRQRLLVPNLFVVNGQNVGQEFLDRKAPIASLIGESRAEAVFANQLPS